MTEKFYLFFYFLFYFIFFFFRLCVMYAFYHLYVCLSFRVEFMLCINYLQKKMILWKYSIQSLKTADAVLLSLFMRDNGICDIPHAS